MAIEAVIFDFGQTLVDSAEGFRSAETAAQELLFADLALTDRDEFLPVYRRIRKACQERGDFSRQTAWREVAKHFGRSADPSRLRQYEADYWRTVNARTAPFPETVGVLTALAETYALAMITNTEAQAGGAAHRVHQFPQVARFFPIIVVAGSGDIPAKPHPQAFAACLDRLGLAPADCVYVGDDWRMDVRGARDAGLRAVWIQHHSVRRHWPDVTPDTPVITDLEALLDLPALLAAE